MFFFFFLLCVCLVLLIFGRNVHLCVWMGFHFVRMNANECVWSVCCTVTLRSRLRLLSCRTARRTRQRNLCSTITCESTERISFACSICERIAAKAAPCDGCVCGADERCCSSVFCCVLLTSTDRGPTGFLLGARPTAVHGRR